MGAIANIAVTDASAVSKTFVPQSNEGGLARWVDRTTSTISAGFRYITSKLDPARNSRPTNYIKQSYTHPFEKTVDGVNVVYATAIKEIKYVIPDGLTEAQRLDFWTLARGAEGHSQLKDSVQYLANPYG